MNRLINYEILLWNRRLQKLLATSTLLNVSQSCNVDKCFDRKYNVGCDRDTGNNVLFHKFSQ